MDDHYLGSDRSHVIEEEVSKCDCVTFVAMSALTGGPILLRSILDGPNRQIWISVKYY